MLYDCQCKGAEIFIDNSFLQFFELSTQCKFLHMHVLDLLTSIEHSTESVSAHLTDYVHVWRLLICNKVVWVLARRK